MTKNLVIVESPTKAKTISRFLGKDYKVVATVGHLRDLPKSRLGVDIENNFEPDYINVRGRAPTINELKKDAKNADKVLLATDPDREGEAISWHLSFLLDLDLNDKNRVEFTEITKDSVKEAILHPRKIDMDLVDSQQARRILDRIVGYKLSPLLWKRIKNGLSAGRVQSVALRLICEREEEIDAFVPQEYWSITADHRADNIDFSSQYFANYIEGKEVNNERITSKKEADEILASLNKKEFKIKSINRRKRRRNPSPPYTTSTLQQDGSNRLGFSTSKTMSLAQQLYEGVNLGDQGTVGLISYMRTDSTRLSPVIIEEAKTYINNGFGDQYFKARSFSKSKEGSQDAHEAVRPTSILRSPVKVKDYLSGDLFKLYELIWKRTVASQMAQAIYEVTTIKMIDNERLFRSTGNTMEFDGFMRLWPTKEKEALLPKLNKDDLVPINKIEKNQHFTKPPARYTEASLVKTLEEEGIGRPSTYSTIIRNILSRSYVRQESRAFYPTEVGIKVNDYLVKHFDNIVNVEFTRIMENNLDHIVDEEASWQDVVGKFYTSFEGSLDKAKEDSTDYKIKDRVLDEKCPECGKNLLEKHGRNGKFIGCSGFPDCKFTKSIVVSTGVACPRCESDIVEKVTKRGRPFYGCSAYPDCDYASWNKPTGERCPDCDDLLTRRKNRHGDFIVCNNEDCDYERPFEKEVKKK